MLQVMNITLALNVLHHHTLFVLLPIVTNTCVFICIKFRVFIHTQLFFQHINYPILNIKLTNIYIYYIYTYHPDKNRIPMNN